MGPKRWDVQWVYRHGDASVARQCAGLPGTSAGLWRLARGPLLFGTLCGVFGAPLDVSILAQARPAAQAPRPGQLAPLPLTQLDERPLAPDFDNRAITLTFAQPAPLREVLLRLVLGTSLSVVAEPVIAGSFFGELKNVTVRQALGLILQPLGLDYSVDGSLIRVFKREPETRIFDVNYVATERTGSVTVGGPTGGGSSARVTSTTSVDLFAELTRGVQTLLSPGAKFNVDRKAGLVQVTDAPERLDRVATYLDAVHDRVHRQVQIDARVIQVELSDADATSLDWAALAQVDPALGTSAAARPALNGLRVTDLPRFLERLAVQGKVTTLATPQVMVMNNETAVVRSASRTAGQKATDPAQEEEGVTLGVTPQIAADGTVMLSLSPIVNVRVSADKSRPATAAGSEADTLARVASGETIVVAGFGRDHDVREQKNAGIKGGWFGRSTVLTRKRVELLVLLTPKILRDVSSQ